MIELLFLIFTIYHYSVLSTMRDELKSCKGEIHSLKLKNIGLVFRQKTKPVVIGDMKEVVQ